MVEKQVEINGVLDVYDYVLVVKNNFKVMLVITSACILAAVASGFFLPKIYQARVTLLPRSSQDNAQLGLTQALPFGLATGLGLDNPANKILLYAKSDGFLRKFIENQGLQTELVSSLWDARRGVWKTPGQKPPGILRLIAALRKTFTITVSDKDSSLEVIFDSRDPARAAALANAFADSLNRYIEATDYTISRKKRVFIGEQLVETRRTLLALEKETRNYLENSQVFSVKSVLDVDVGLDDVLPRDFSQDRLPSEIGSKVDDTPGASEAEATVSRVPQEAYLEFLGLKKQTLVQVASLLTEQYELAKIEEKKESLSFQIVDSALEPERSTKPKMKLIVALAAVSGMILALLYVFLVESVRAYRKLANKERG